MQSHSARSLPVVFLGFVGSIQVGDPVIASLALVRATQALAFSPTMQAMAAAISTLALAATVVPAGVVADKLGRRKLLIIALLLTAVGDLITAMAPVPWVYLVGRALAGVGLGAVFAGSYAFVRDVVPPRILPAALGVYAAMCLVPLFIYMPLGSALAGIDWRLAFLPIPVVASMAAWLCIPILPLVPPVVSEQSRQFWGLAVLGLGIVCLLIGVSSLANSLTAPSTLLPLVLGIVALGAFGLIEARAEAPSFPIGLLTSPLFIVGAIGGFAWNAATAVGQLLSSNLWQYVDGVTPFVASLRQLPMMAFSIVASLYAGHVIGRGRSAVGTLVLGGVITTGGLVATAALAPNSTGVWFLGALCVVFFGTGVMTVPQSQMFVQEAPAEFYGPVTSSRVSVGQFAYAVGLAGGAAVASAVTTSRLASGSGVSSATASAQVADFIAGDDAAALLVGPYYVTGFAAAMIVFAGVIAACTVVIVLLGRRAQAHANNLEVDASNT